MDIKKVTIFSFMLVSSFSFFSLHSMVHEGADTKAGNSTNQVDWGELPVDVQNKALQYVGNWSSGNSLLHQQLLGDIARKHELTGQHHPLSLEPYPISDVVFSPDGNKLASASKDAMVQIYNSVTGTKVMSLSKHVGTVNSVSWSPSGKQLATASSENQAVRVWDTADSKSATLVIPCRTYIVKWSPNGKWLATVESNDVLIWNAVDGKEVKRFIGAARSLAWSPDGKFLAVGLRNDDNSVKVWDVKTEEKVIELAGNCIVASIAWSPDGKKLATIERSGDNSVKVWDVQTGEKVKDLAHRGSANALAWSPDSSKLAFGLHSNVGIWGDDVVIPDLPVIQLSGHSSPITAVAWNSNGELASGSHDEKVRIWDMPSFYAVIQWLKSGCPSMKKTFEFEEKETKKKYSKPVRPFVLHALLVRLMAAKKEKIKTGLSIAERAYWHCLPREVQVALKCAIKPKKRGLGEAVSGFFNRVQQMGVIDAMRPQEEEEVCEIPLGIPLIEKDTLFDCADGLEAGTASASTDGKEEA